MAYERSIHNEGGPEDLLFCESCEKYENLAAERGKVFVEVLSDRRRVEGNTGAKFVLKDYQLRTPVSVSDKKWLVYDLGKEKVYYLREDGSYEIEVSGHVHRFEDCAEMVAYFQPRIVNYRPDS